MNYSYKFDIGQLDLKSDDMGHLKKKKHGFINPLLDALSYKVDYDFKSYCLLIIKRFTVRVLCCKKDKTIRISKGVEIFEKAK